MSRRARIRRSAWLFVVLLAVAAVPWLGGGVAAANLPPPAPVFVYTGNSPIAVIPFNSFGTATGRPVTSSASLPPDLSANGCVILNLNQTVFDAGQKATLASYVNGGGRLFAVGDNPSAASTVNTTMNDLATSFGATMSLDNSAGTFDPGFNTTTNIDPSVFTTGVSTIRFGASSKLVASGSAQTLVRTTGTSGAVVPFIGAQLIGSGLFVLQGDTNWISDQSDTGYTAQNNGVLAANLCNGPLSAAPPTPPSPPPPTPSDGGNGGSAGAGGRGGGGGNGARVTAHAGAGGNAGPCGGGGAGGGALAAGGGGAGGGGCFDVTATASIATHGLVVLANVGKQGSAIRAEALSDMGRPEWALTGTLQPVGATTVRSVNAGRMRLVVPFTAKARRQLKRVRRATVTLRLSLLPPQGRALTTTRQVTLKG